MPIKRHVLWRANVREVRVCENVKRRRKRSCCHGQQPCCHMQQGVWAGSWVILLHVFIVTFSLSLIKWTLSRGCRRFAEPCKILCQCALASYEQISVHPRSVHGVPEFPNNWYQSTWFKGVFDFFSKMKVVKIVFWPYHCVEEEETKPPVKTASKSDVGHGRTLRQGVCPRAQTRPTRLLHPDELTRPEYQLTWPMWLTRIRMTSAWHKSDVIMNSRHARDGISMM